MKGNKGRPVSKMDRNISHFAPTAGWFTSLAPISGCHLVVAWHQHYVAKFTRLSMTFLIDRCIPLQINARLPFFCAFFRSSWTITLDETCNTLKVDYFFCLAGRERRKGFAEKINSISSLLLLRVGTSFYEEIWKDRPAVVYPTEWRKWKVLS